MPKTPPELFQMMVKQHWSKLSLNFSKVDNLELILYAIARRLSPYQRHLLWIDWRKAGKKVFDGWETNIGVYTMMVVGLRRITKRFHGNIQQIRICQNEIVVELKEKQGIRIAPAIAEEAEEASKGGEFRFAFQRDMDLLLVMHVCFSMEKIVDQKFFEEYERSLDASNRLVGKDDSKANQYMYKRSVNSLIFPDDCETFQPLDSHRIKIFPRESVTNDWNKSQFLKPEETIKANLDSILDEELLSRWTNTIQIVYQRNQGYSSPYQDELSRVMLKFLKRYHSSSPMVEHFARIHQIQTISLSEIFQDLLNSEFVAKVKEYAKNCYEHESLQRFEHHFEPRRVEIRKEVDQWMDEEIKSKMKELMRCFPQERDRQQRLIRNWKIIFEKIFARVSESALQTQDRIDSLNSNEEQSVIQIPFCNLFTKVF